MRDRTVDRTPPHPQPPSVPATERRNASSIRLDDLTTVEVLQLMNAEDRRGTDAVAAVLPFVAELVDVAALRIRAGGAVHYFGAGTSGRLGMLDAAELQPTFALPPGVVVGHLAGGDAALVRAIEDVEDSREGGARDAASLGSDDLAIGLTASGQTPYVGGALAAASARGAYTALIACNAEPALADHAQLVIAVDTGPEVLTGSTRLKAGTAQKLILNGFSTALMVRLGRTWSNLMVSVVATNNKLRRRTVRILMDALSISEEESRRLLHECDGDLRTALVAALGGVGPGAARAALSASGDAVGGAVRALARSHPPIPTDPNVLTDSTG